MAEEEELYGKEWVPGSEMWGYSLCAHWVLRMNNISVCDFWDGIDNCKIGGKEMKIDKNDKEKNELIGTISGLRYFAQEKDDIYKVYGEKYMADWNVDDTRLLPYVFCGSFYDGLMDKEHILFTHHRGDGIKKLKNKSNGKERKYEFECMSSPFVWQDGTHLLDNIKENRNGMGDIDIDFLMNKRENRNELEGVKYGLIPFANLYNAKANARVEDDLVVNGFDEFSVYANRPISSNSYLYFDISYLKMVSSGVRALYIDSMNNNNIEKLKRMRMHQRPHYKYEALEYAEPNGILVNSKWRPCHVSEMK